MGFNIIWTGKTSLHARRKRLTTNNAGCAKFRPVNLNGYDEHEEKTRFGGWAFSLNPTSSDLMGFKNNAAPQPANNRRREGHIPLYPVPYRKKISLPLQFSNYR